MPQTLQRPGVTLEANQTPSNSLPHLQRIWQLQTWIWWKATPESLVAVTGGIKDMDASDQAQEDLSVHVVHARHAQELVQESSTRATTFYCARLGALPLMTLARLSKICSLFVFDPIYLLNDCSIKRNCLASKLVSVVTSHRIVTFSTAYC